MYQDVLIFPLKFSILPLIKGINSIFIISYPFPKYKLCAVVNTISSPIKIPIPKLVHLFLVFGEIKVCFNLPKNIYGNIEK